MQPNSTSTFSVMTLGDHLDELRRRLLWAIAMPIPVAIAAFVWAEPIRNMMCDPAMDALRAHDLPAQLQVLSPLETLGTDLKLSVVTAVVFSAPWIVLQIWKFVEPGLFAHERRFVRLLVPMSGLLTLAGLALLYFLLLPMMLTVLVGFGSEPPLTMAAATSDSAITTPAVATIPTLSQPPENPRAGQMWVTPDHRLAITVAIDDKNLEVLTVPMLHGARLAQQFRLSEYLDFVLDFALGTVVAFQTPLVVLLLGWLGILSSDALKNFRRYAIFLAALIAAVVTPSTDPFSMTLLAVPVYLLYELGILMLKVAPPSAVSKGEVLSRLLRVVRGRDA